MFMSETWVDQTTAFDRVRSVALSLSEPRPAAWIAEEAQVAENTARSHLSRLADLGVLRTSSTEEGTAYAPDPIYSRSQDIRELVQNNTEDQLASRAVEYQEELEAIRTGHEADSPEALRASVATAEGPEEARERLEAASDWEYARYRLDLISEALEYYEAYRSRDPASV